MCPLYLETPCFVEEPGLWLFPAPVLAECVQQRGAQRHIAIFTAFALTDVYDPTLAIDVLHPKPEQLAATHAGRVKRHEDGACLEIAGGVDERATSSGLNTCGTR